MVIGHWCGILSCVRQVLSTSGWFGGAGSVDYQTTGGHQITTTLMSHLSSETVEVRLLPVFECGVGHNNCHVSILFGGNHLTNEVLMTIVTPVLHQDTLLKLPLALHG